MGTMNQDQTKESNMGEDTYEKVVIDYDPTHFLRCHSKKNDSSDVQTQVWQCAFQPDYSDRRKTTSLVATCGGNSVCFINVKEGIVPYKYYAKDSREMLYALAWTVNRCYTFLVCAGAMYSVHFLDSENGIAFGVKALKNKKSRKKMGQINSLLFHPEHWNLLFCGGSDGDIHICNIGDPCPPEYKVDLVVLQRFSTNTEIFSFTFCRSNNTLLMGCDNGLFGWKFPDDIVAATKSEEQSIKFTLPEMPPREGCPPQYLVDSVEAMGDGVIATKCAIHGVIYLWSLTDTFNSGTFNVRPTHILQWSSTDNYFMSIGVQAEANMLSCGDDQGRLWMYDLHGLRSAEADSPVTVKPTCILPWPHLSDPHTDKKRKLSVDTYDIVVAKVAISSDRDNIVAVTNNNMVCIWQKCGP